MISTVEQPLLVGKYVDFKDNTTYDWQVGFIISQTGNKVKVRTEGWSDKYDENVSITSDRLKPFRSLVRGYTGQKKKPALREHWKYSIQDHEQRMKYFKEFKLSWNHKEEDWNQYIRGSHYFYIDSLMGLTYKSAEEMTKTYVFFKDHISFVKQYLERFIKSGCEEYFGSQQKKIEREACYEIFDAMTILSALYPRHSSFSKSNEKIISQLTQGITYQANIITLIKQSKLDLVYSKAVDLIDQYEAQALPIYFLNSFFKLFFVLENSFLQREEDGEIQKEVRKKMVFILVSVMRRNLDQIKAEDMKSQQNQKDLEILLSDLFTVSFKYGLEKFMFQWIKTTKVRVYSMLIEADSVQRKLKGISQLKDLYEMTAPSNEYVMYQLSSKAFLEILHQNKVIQKLFVYNDHPEIAKKGGQLWLNFYKNGGAPFKDLEFIWNNCMTKHESVKKIAFLLWTDAVESANEDLSLFVNKIVSQYNLKEETKDVEEWEFEMLVNYAQKLFKFISADKLGGSPEKPVTPDNSEANKQLIMVCYQNLLKIKAQPDLQQKIANFAKLIIYCGEFNNIIKESYIKIGKNEQVSLHCELLFNFYSNSSRPQTFLATNAFKILFSALENNEALSQSIFRLITQIAHFSSIYADFELFNLEQFETLWKISHSHPETRKQFFKWLLKEHYHSLSGTKSYQINTIISEELRTDIFSKFLCDFSKVDFINLTLEELDIFRQFLLDCNLRENRIEINFFAGMLRVIKVKDQEILGNKFVWDIFLNCKNPEVLKKLNQIIIILNLHTETLCNETARLNKLSILMSKIQKNLKDGYRKGNYRILKASLDLLSATIHFFRQKYQEKTKSEFQQFKFKHKVKFEDDICEIQTSLSCSYKELKNKLSQKIKIDVTQFKLLNGKKNVIGIQYGHIPYCFMQEKQLEILKKPEKEKTSISYTLDYVSEKIENSLITMIEDEQICQSIYELWKDLEAKQTEIQSFIQKITKSISNKKSKSKDNKTSKSQIYSLLLLLKFIQNVSDQTLQQTASANPAFVLDFVQLLDSEIIQSQMIELQSTSTIMILKLFKVLSQKKPQGLVYLKKIEDDVCNKCLKQIQILTIGLDRGIIDQNEKIRVAKITLNCLNIIDHIKGENTLDYLFKHPSFTQTVTVTYLSKTITTSRIIVTEKIKKIAKVIIEKYEILPEEIQEKMFELFSSVLYPQVIKKDGLNSLEIGTFHFYSILSFFISISSQKMFEKFIIDSSFYEKIIKYLSQLKDQRNQLCCNYILKGHFELLRSILEKKPHLLTPSLLENLLYNHLFFSQNKTSSNNVNCLHKDSIQSCLKAIHAGSKNNNPAVKAITECLNEFKKEQYWKIDNDWCIESQIQKKEKFKGLENPGCICFMNSFLQQLYMNNFFKNSLLNTQTQISEDILPSQVLYKLKKLFLQMIFSEESTLSSIPFSRSIKQYDDKPMISIYNQMDIDEFSNILFDRMEQQLKGLGLGDFVKNIFGGTFAQQIVSHQCPHSSEIQQDFSSIGLEVRKNLSDSFASLVKGEMLDGQNKYYCQRCDKKVKAQKILSIKRLPQCLIIGLKRFEYNFDYDAKIKKNDFCEFPHQLNVKQFTQREVLSHLFQNQQNQVLLKTKESQADKQYQYQLKGVVIHMGSADSGHYYSIIRAQKDKWIEFNDSNISSFNVEDLPAEAFGSKDEFDTKNKNAYLLFYQKVTNTLKYESQEKALSMQQNQKIINEIEAKNKQIQKRKIFFSQAFSEFINNMWLNLQASGEQELMSQFNQYLIDYYSTIRIREALMDKFVSFSKQIQTLLQDNTQSQFYFLKKFENLAFIEDIYVYCSMRHKCQIVTCLWAQSFLRMLDVNPDYIQEGQLLWNILKNVINLILLYGNINQVNKFVRKLFETKNKRIFKVFILLDFPILCLKSILGKQSSKEDKNEICKDLKLKYDRQDDDDTCYDKKYITPNKLQGWKVLDYLLTYLVGQDQDYYEEVDDLKTILINDIKEENYHKLIYEIKNGLALQYFYICFKKLGLIYDLLPSIEKGLKEFESTKYRPLLVFCSLIIKDKDTDQEMLKDLSDIIQKVFVTNQKYFLESNLILQWSIKFVNSNVLFWKNFTEDEDTIDRILQWIDKHKKPSADLVKKHKNPLNERLLNRINGVLVSFDPKKYEDNSNKMAQTFNFMKDQSYCEGIVEPSSFRSEREFNVGSEVKIMTISSGIYKYGRIVESTFGRLKIKIEGIASHMELDQDDELISLLTETDIKEKSSKEEFQLKKI